MNIVVLAGGLSTERDVSFVTSREVSKALRANGHKVIMIDVFMGYGDSECDVSKAFSDPDRYTVNPEEIKEKAPDLAAVKAMRHDQSKNFFGPNVIALCRQADIVFMGLHGENGENGKIQAAFDLFGIKYTGSGYLASAIAMNKHTAKTVFSAAGVRCPNGTYITKDHASEHPPFPVVVKPNAGGSSIGVTIAHDEAEYQKALEDAFFWEDTVIVEEYVKGREFSIGVIEGKALPIIEIAPITGFYDYKNKYKAGSAVETCPAELTEDETKKMQGLAEAAAKSIGMDKYGRIDFLMREDGQMFCLEANTLPGMTPTSLLPQEAKVTGLDFNALVEKLINVSL